MQNYQKRKKMEEWVKVADLMAVASLEEKKMIQNEEAVMEMKERLARLRSELELTPAFYLMISMKSINTKHCSTERTISKKR